MIPHPDSTAVIGAGIAGLACARSLADAGRPVTVFEKGRGPGGRMSSRHLTGAVVELGAQYFSVRDADFGEQVATWQRAGVVAPWPAVVWRLTTGRPSRRSDDRPRFTGTPRMSALLRHLAGDLPLHTATRIVALENADDGWRLISEAGTRHGLFATVVLALPAPQAEALVAPHDADLAEACRGIPQRACWAGWARFDAPLPPLPGLATDWQVLELAEGPLRLVTRNQTKPGREAQGESLTLLARLDWSERRLEEDAGSVSARLLDALQAALPEGVTLPMPRHSGAHRWRFAQPAALPGSGFPDFRQGESGLALCGDAWRDARVEDAWLSGHRLGRALACRPPIPHATEIP
ncbi:NAD(P)/FAD-dependent oxidoreductase [Halomonas nitroreducens]|uniref:FAD-dependent oxidoreductase n=1 Tax=Halomonas nitroreducens TaxID=447425 RepID=A0A3S0HNS2_9GAMM|nr:FAD-dependent oxidoreductase [Halomonas nitroreducens]RTR01517.1 FAD-dependent oxidoreductase [Halomonas nitroreducens]